MKNKKQKSRSLDGYLKKVEELKTKVGEKKKPEKPSKEIQYFRSLLEITRSINTFQDFEQLLELIVDSAILLTKAERGFLMLFGKEGRLEFKVARNIKKETLETEEFRISRSVVNKVAASSKPIFLSDIYQDKEFQITESIADLGLRMVMCVPLKAKDHLLGLVYIDSHSVTETFTDIQEKLLEAFAAQASVAIENGHLYELSVRDQLTGLYNYGYLCLRIEEEITRALRYKKENISFIMLDLDNFKSINDSYGHLFGNTILMKVGEVIKNTVRTCDIPTRYGGDEFAILMPETDIQGAKCFAERLRKEIANQRLLTGKEGFSITASFGISSFPVDKIISAEGIIVEADHALFIAKSKGGDRIICFAIPKGEKRDDFGIIGGSKKIEDIKKTVARLAKTDTTLLIIGETGTGKELITQLIHNKSPRKDKPFVVVNCGAIPETLLESELFGYEKGAFTGAYTQHKGKFEIAQGGTLFLDEISELPFHLQIKILRAIEQKEIDRIAGKSPIRLNVRVIASSNKDLEEEVKKGNFREDLFYRLNVATIYLPPLKERVEDIEPLTHYYLNLMNKKYQRRFRGFTKPAMDVMMRHKWPGNIRELIHRIERAVIMSTNQYLDEKDLGLTLPEFKENKDLKQTRNEAEKEGVIQALIRNRWNISQTSNELGISRKTLRDLMKKHNILKPKILKSKIE